MTLIKTSLLNAIAVVIKMLTLLGINKILAVYVGPTGYAALGQFQNAVQMITTFGSGAGLGLAIVQGIVEAHGGSVVVANRTPGCEFLVRLPSAGALTTR